MQTRISPTPLPVEEAFSEETRAFLAYARGLPPIPEADDPNGWFSQIAAHLKRSPRQRMERWAACADGLLRFGFERRGEGHVRFDPVRVLRTLTDRGVGFVFVGMGAGYVRGAPYPSYNTDVTPSMEPDNLARVEEVLGVLEARPLERDEWGPIEEHTLAGYRRLMTSAGMVNVVDALPGVGDYPRIMGNADLLDLADGLSVWVATLEDVICSKETVGELIVGTPPYGRMMDGVHVLMCKETLALEEKYGTEWNLSLGSYRRSLPTGREW